MTWDLKLDPETRDLVPGFVSGADEIIQRLITRLLREQGEWFLAEHGGLPWFGDLGGRQARVVRRHTTGRQGLLGSGARTRRETELLIRREALETEGIERVLAVNARYDAATRALSLYLRLFVTGAGPVSVYISRDGNGCLSCKTGGENG